MEEEVTGYGNLQVGKGAKCSAPPLKLEIF